MEYVINLEQEWTPETFAEEMRKIREHCKVDYEERHLVMDAVMVHVLTQLGYGDGAQVFANTNKWYA